METLRRWSDSASAQAERLPLLGRLQSGTRKGLLLGAALGMAFLFLLGGVLGGLNRGPGGAVIGAFCGALLGLVLGSIGGAFLGTRYLPQEGHAVVSIELDDPSGRFAPGQTVSGRVRLIAENTLRILGGKAYFACRGFYLADTISENGSSQLEFTREAHEYLVQEANIIPTGIIRRGGAHRYPFRFTVPLEALPTHHGYVCSVHWTLHAVLDVPDIERITAQREIAVEAQPTMLSVSRAEYQSTTSAQVCQMTLSLPRAIYAQGEKVSGRVQITALESFEAADIRAVLLRVESTLRGDDHIVYVNGWDQVTGLFHGERRPGGQGTTYVWLEGEVNLSDVVGFKVAETTTLNFALDLPADWRPTFATKDGRVIWKVGVIISRPERSDVRAFHEIVVHTAEPQFADMLASNPLDF